MGRRRGLFVSAAMVAVAVLAARPAAATVPAGFVDEAVGSVSAPTAIAFTPDGRMLVTTQPGQFQVRPAPYSSAVVALDLAALPGAGSVVLLLVRGRGPGPRDHDAGRARHLHRDLCPRARARRGRHRSPPGRPSARLVPRGWCPAERGTAHPEPRRRGLGRRPGADFDRDGRADLRWRNSSTGELYVWYLDGTTVVSSAYVTPSRIANLDWAVAPR